VVIARRVTTLGRLATRSAALVGALVFFFGAAGATGWLMAAVTNTSRGKAARYAAPAMRRKLRRRCLLTSGPRGILGDYVQKRRGAGDPRCTVPAGCSRAGGR